MHGALASICCAGKAGVCIWEAFLQTHRRVLVYKSMCLSLMWLCSFELIQYHAEVNGRGGKAYKPTHGSTNLHEHVLVLKQTTVLSRLQPFPRLLLYFSVWKYWIYFAFSEVFLVIQEMHLCQCFIYLRRQMTSTGDWWCSAHSWEVFLISLISCVLSSCSPLYPQCVLHLPQLCRDNLHSPRSLAATPSCPWAKKSPYCSKEHMQQSLMLTLIVPIQTTQ